MPVVLYKRQRQILEFVQNFIKKYGYSPTLMEIAQAMGLSSPATVHEHIKILEKKGIIKRNLNEVRGIEIVQEFETGIVADATIGLELPLLGYIHAGSPLEPYDDPTATFKVSANLVPKNKIAFVLQVKGDSMIEDGIIPGDYVVLVKEENVKDGDIVVALIESGLATLKRIYREDGKVKLMPANSTMQPIYATDVQVQGKVAALIRKYV
ncbi:MAG: LexA repressor [Microgenomates group bacterium GW2011_GWA1_48_10]|uniref:LexA repressor n=1 Tax=Candidatus Gottesmanbacteria bacterium RIFCSPHIGHO2_01_FULL_47_48 TaxID=1798381 RepID=A0A1F5ZZ56_9BACT|nr:MAG: LexA repressor [Microgenomates group bacterium GW2011_GWA1_48_10]OGG17728.1 MAG: repressor LexA [Candidatus Gottesmanbacteria bacterium RIFCSPHIGHO2_01_FULL_47_48]